MTPRPPSSRPYDRLLFDLDGTLTDPLEGISRSLNHALVHFGYAPRPAAELARYIGPPLDTIFADLTGAPREHVGELVAKYRERYGEVGFAESSVYPGVPEALAALRAAGLPLAVCTSKRADFAERILALFGLRELFDFVDGGDVGIAKWQQIEALRAEGRVGEGTLMIGDRGVDLVAARRNGLAGAGVLWGYGSRDELVAEAPAHLFHAPAEWTLLAAGRSPHAPPGAA